MQIIIQRIPYSSSEFEYNTSISSSSNGIVYSLIQHLSEIFGDIVGINNSSNLLSFSFHTSATTCLQHIYTIHVENNGYQTKYWIGYYEIIIQTATKVLAICNFDAYSGDLNFVLGEAHMGGRVAAIYIPRLKQGLYVKKSDINKLVEQRAIKEAVHELGHAFGLTHCEKSRCVMHFSNSLQDTDFKHYIFCERCNKILREQTTSK